MKIFIVIICIVIAMTIISTSILCDSVEIDSDEFDEKDDRDIYVPEEEHELLPPAPVPRPIIQNMNDLYTRIEKHPKNKNTTSNSVDSRQSRMEGRDYPRYYEDR